VCISERAFCGPLWQSFKLRLKLFPPAQAALQKKIGGVRMSVVILGAKSRRSSRSLGSTRCRNGRLFVTQKPRLRPPALAFANHRPGQKPTEAKVVGPAWPGFFWPGLARLLASGRSRHITNPNMAFSTFGSLGHRWLPSSKTPDQTDSRRTGLTSVNLRRQSVRTRLRICIRILQCHTKVSGSSDSAIYSTP